MINNRCIGILRYLQGQRYPLSIMLLADHFDVCNRSIRNDIEKINEWLVSNKLSPLHIIPGLGVQHVGEWDEISESLRRYTIKSYLLSPEERVLALAGKLLCEDANITSNYAANLFVLSVPTASNDIRGLKAWLNKYNLSYISKPNTGMQMDCSEIDIRRGCYEMLKEMMATSHNFCLRMISSQFEDLQVMLNNYRLDKLSIHLDKYRQPLVDLIEKLQKSRKTTLTDAGYCELFLDLLVATVRQSQGHSVEDSHFESPFFQKLKLRRDVDLSIIKNWSSLHLKNEKENEYFLLALISVSRFGALEEIDLLDMDMTDEFIKNVKNRLQKTNNLSVQAIAELGGTLDSFLSCQLLRKDHSQIQHIEDIGGVVGRYPAIYRAVEEELQRVALIHLGHLPVREGHFAQEVTFLLISSEWDVTFEEPQNLLDVILVCSSNLFLARYLESRLKRMFSNINILGLQPVHQFLGTREHLNCDTIISTVPLGDIGIQHIHINPLLSNKDIIKLMSAIPFQLQFKCDYNAMNETVRVTIDSLDIQPHQQLLILADIAKTLQEHFDWTHKNPGLGIRNLLDESLIRVKVGAKDCSDAIQLAGNLLIRKNLIQQKHVDEMIFLNNQYPGYSVIDDGVAMPHLLTKDINSPCMSVVTLNTPIPMRKNSERMVSLILMLLTNDNTSHLNIIAEIISLLESPLNKRLIMAAKCPKELLAIVNYNYWTMMQEGGSAQ